MGIVLEQFDDYIAVESIASNSQASKYSSLVIGSILEKVGNVSIKGKSFDSTMDLLKTSPRPLDLTFRPKENSNTKMKIILVGFIKV